MHTRARGRARQHLERRTAMPTVRTELLTAHDLSKRFGFRRVFERVDLRLGAGDVLLVTGPNGSGKTTLLRVLAGLAAPSGGELERPHRGRIGYLGHEP